MATPGVVSSNSVCALIGQDDFRLWALVTLRDAQQADCGIKTLYDLIAASATKPVRPGLSIMSREMRQLAQWKQLCISKGLLCRWKIKGKQ